MIVGKAVLGGRAGGQELVMALGSGLCQEASGVGKKPFFCGLSSAKMAFFQPLSLPDAYTDAPKPALARLRFVALARER